MHKKKSYMDNKNVLRESFFDKIKKMLGLSTSQEKELKKNKKIIKIFKDLNSDVKEFEKQAEDMFKDLGIKRKVNIKKYQYYTMLYELYSMVKI